MMKTWAQHRAEQLQADRAYLRAVLQAACYRSREAARLAHCNRTDFYRKLHKHGLVTMLRKYRVNKGNDAWESLT